MPHNGGLPLRGIGDLLPRDYFLGHRVYTPLGAKAHLFPQIWAPWGKLGEDPLKVPFKIFQFTFPH